MVRVDGDFGLNLRGQYGGNDGILRVDNPGKADRRRCPRLSTLPSAVLRAKPILILRRFRRLPCRHQKLSAFPTAPQ
jgi:hypothetical protein